MALYGVNSGLATNDADIIQGLNNQFTGNLDYQRSLDTLQKEQNFSKFMAENAHQMEADDLIKAGYNPALTLGTGGASASSPSAKSFSSGEGYSSLVKFIGSIIGIMSQNARSAEYLSQKQELANDKLDYLYDKMSNNTSNKAYDRISRENIANDKLAQEAKHHAEKQALEQAKFENYAYNKRRQLNAYEVFNGEKAQNARDKLALDTDKFDYNRSKGFRG